MMRQILLVLAFTAVGAFAQTIEAIVNVADYTPRITFHSLAAIFGSQLSARTCAATLIPLPNELCGVSVQFTDATGAQALAPLLYVSPSQINFQMPATQWLNGKDPIRRETVVATVTACVLPVNACRPLGIERQAPAIFGYARTASQVDPIITHLNGLLVSPSSPAAWGETLVIYATGFSYQSTTFPRDGEPAPLDRLVEIVDWFTVHIETGKVGNVSIGESISSVFAGLAPGFVGLNQINFTLSRAYQRPGPVFIFLKGVLEGQSQSVPLYVQ